jgi:hypothetical protein
LPGFGVEGGKTDFRESWGGKVDFFLFMVFFHLCGFVDHFFSYDRTDSGLRLTKIFNSDEQNEHVAYWIHCFTGISRS